MAELVEMRLGGRLMCPEYHVGVHSLPSKGLSTPALATKWHRAGVDNFVARCDLVACYNVAGAGVDKP